MNEFLVQQKEFHELRYTNQIGIEKQAQYIGAYFAYCLNMKKLVKIKKGRAERGVSLEKQSYSL
uniref:hypothetical protein n=1 Tax=Enterococcus mundtii TaxID=53346 RepID=UPI0035C10F39